jgi:hypothetical protein
VALGWRRCSKRVTNTDIKILSLCLGLLGAEHVLVSTDPSRMYGSFFRSLRPEARAPSRARRLVFERVVKEEERWRR